MKTSNKLLIGLLCLILFGMIVFNFSLTKEIKKTSGPNNQISLQPANDSLLIKMDSVSINNDFNNQ